ncbi:hypothetical protein BSLG_004025 [Batrachochytrium salamandrivorans]|nr:hypothetical protein BSLG_004025 [Batrachochytrium salamandrivorans]
MDMTILKLTGLPDPFAVVTIDGEQTRSTLVIKRTLNPYWNQSFDLLLRNESVITVQIFDQRKWKKDKNQGFLGVINVQMGSIFNVQAAGDEMLTVELKKSSSRDVVTAKLAINLSTNLDQLAPLMSKVMRGSLTNSAGMDAASDATSKPGGSGTHLSPHAAGPSGASRLSSDGNSINGMTSLEDQFGPLPLSVNASQEQRAITEIERELHNRTLPGESGSSASLEAPTPNAPEVASFVSLQDPNAPVGASSMSSAVDAPAQTAVASLEQRITPEGRSYFVDHNTRTTTWLDLSFYTAVECWTGSITQLAVAQQQSQQALTIAFRNNVPQYKRDFRRKLVYFRSQPALRPIPGQVHVAGEDGLDYGGLSRKSHPDMESVDADLYRSLNWTLENSIEGVLDLTFTAEDERFGEIVMELKPDGRNITRVEEQHKAFSEGFHELIPRDLVNVFDERELEKARLLQFVTGTSRIPVNGFKDLQGSDGPRRFTIEKTGEIESLPKSHTCFNRLDLPPYRNEGLYLQKITLAIEETIGFCKNKICCVGLIDVALAT